MKNIVCPISVERVPEHLPRVTALFVITLLVGFVITGYTPILLALSLDFIARGSGFAKFSPLHYASVKLSGSLKLKSELIDKAPKVFAARLGAVMITAAVILEVLSYNTTASAIALVVSFFALLECVFNFCVGCYVYSLLVLPFYSKK